ncbi:pullulanase-type alpha-1,6-glucosidase [Terriglobus aquaticus]|uniref:pullulanase n=1 Tax=Terriglobus aquaticus TaxID=940139 RepID=A0ABW9KF01_9BACT|nr:pullulanase-type alpha-1,6-glucosidase [Terriglobus aquaticus]
MRLSARLLVLVAVVFACFGCGLTAQTSAPIPANHVRIHYHRSDGNYGGWTVYAFGGTTEDQGNYNGGPVQQSGSDSFGAFYDVGIVAGTTDVGIIVHNPTAAGGDQKDPGPDEHINPSAQGNEYYQLSGVVGLTTTMPDITSHKNPAIPANTARIHFFRPDNNYTGWTVYGFRDSATDQGNYNGGPVQQTGTDSYGAYYDVALIPNAQSLGFIVHNIQTGTKNTPADLFLNVALYNEAWIISGDPTVYLQPPSAADLLNANFYKLQAFWIDSTTIAIQSVYASSGTSFYLVSSPNAGMTITAKGVTGSGLPLTTGGTLSAQQLARFPQLKGYTALQLRGNLKPAEYRKLLTGQLAVEALKSDGTLGYATGVQDAGVLDDLYAYSGKLGVVIRKQGVSSADDEWNDFADEQDGDVKIKVWAPTAQAMKLQLFTNSTDTAPAQVLPMRNHNGVWVARLDSSWISKYYLFDETVYAPSTRSIVENIVSDPYSTDLALNGSKSRITDFTADTNQPQGWDADRAPALARVNDLSIYELHVRDFSVNDATVPEEHRGTYLAFTDANSDGMRHLRTLADSGLKAIHLLPTFHFNSVNEDKSTWKTTPNLNGLPPDSQQQQAAVAAVQGSDAYNWGYDPDHYLAVEGSYAVNPDNRVKEYRQMVMGLHSAGLRVIQDVVFNHTSGFGEASNSILDEVVPNYYNRLDADGALLNASCCADTATEHLMMGKLQQDAIVWNAKQYKIDGFRFDIMSFTFVPNLQAIRQALAKLTLAKDGIDGSKSYIYGEGFSFGETANSALGVNAQQSNLYGTGIGSFNDRIRDGVRGGGPFDDERVQGFATGLFTAPSSYTSGITPLLDQKSTLLHRSDWIRVGLTGNLRDYKFTDSTGNQNTGGGLDYQGQPTGYTASPVEAVNYVSVHDNQDIFDAIQVKAATTEPAATRARRQVLAMSLVELGQGIPFFQAGDDLLRSKSLDQNSYDSGDWFNKIDWTGQGNNWGIGLPIQSQNGSQWSFQQPLLANTALQPSPADIATTTTAFQEFLKIRNGSSLFRMTSAPEIQQNLTFLNTGTTQTPGLIVMRLSNTNGLSYSGYSNIVVVFNATSTQQSFTSATLANQHLALHPIQRRSGDAVVRNATANNKTGTLTVPALTTAVFVGE